jgi:HEPN domain-containing protein
MSRSKRKTIEGWIEKAGHQLQAAKDHSQSYYHSSEAIEAAQECIELSIKSALFLLGIEYKFKHAWSWEDFVDIAKQIQQKQLLDRLEEQNVYYCLRLPRLLLLANLWGHFYLPAKYGFAEYLASAQDLFEKQEAELAVLHAGECYQAALELRNLGEDKLAAILHKQE